MAVMKTDRTNKGIRSIVMPIDHMLITVFLKLTAPRIEETPAK